MYRSDSDDGHCSDGGWSVMLNMVRLLVISNKALQSRDELSWLAALSRGEGRAHLTWLDKLQVIGDSPSQLSSAQIIQAKRSNPCHLFKQPNCEYLVLRQNFYPGLSAARHTWFKIICHSIYLTLSMTCWFNKGTWQWHVHHKPWRPERTWRKQARCHSLAATYPIQPSNPPQRSTLLKLPLRCFFPTRSSNTYTSMEMYYSPHVTIFKTLI